LPPLGRDALHASRFCPWVVSLVIFELDEDKKKLRRMQCVSTCPFDIRFYPSLFKPVSLINARYLSCSSPTMERKGQRDTAAMIPHKSATTKTTIAIYSSFFLPILLNPGVAMLRLTMNPGPPTCKSPGLPSFKARPPSERGCYFPDAHACAGRPRTPATCDRSR